MLMKDRTFLAIVVIAAIVLAVLAFTAGTASGQVDSEKNHPAYWGETCTKIDNYQGGNSWESQNGYQLVVLKSATNYWEFESVSLGDVLTTPDGKDISHIVVCLPFTTTTTVPPTTTTSLVETATTTEPPTTTTTQGPTSSTVTSSSSTTTETSQSPSTSTTVNLETTTTGPSTPVDQDGPNDPPAELPYTGAADTILLAAAATALLATGVATLRKSERHSSEAGGRA